MVSGGGDLGVGAGALRVISAVASISLVILQQNNEVPASTNLSVHLVVIL